MTLEEIAENAVNHTATLTGIAQAQTSAARLGKLCNDLSRHYRALGTYGLLMNADTETFFHCLIQSALTRKYYLERSGREGVLQEPARRASFADPFFDAVAAGQPRLAAEIGALSPADWQRGFEYEDDFAYARFLYRLVTGDPAVEPQLDAELERFAAALEDGESVRLELCLALRTHDQPRFDEAFDALLLQRADEYEELADPSGDSIPSQELSFEANRRIFIEGLALLKLAEARGLQTRPEYDMCPALVREPVYGPFHPIAFPHLELES